MDEQTQQVIPPTFDDWLSSREGQLWTEQDSGRVRKYILDGEKLALEVLRRHVGGEAAVSFRGAA